MPISADRFEEIDPDEEQPKPETNAARILEFLEEHPNEAFTQTEIAEATEITRGSVGPTLVRLRERGRGRNRGDTDANRRVLGGDRERDTHRGGKNRR